MSPLTRLALVQITYVSILIQVKGFERNSWGGIVRIAALSTMLRMVNLFIALSFGVHLEQLEHRMGLT